jgi:carboxymethylenebutenolidase
MIEQQAVVTTRSGNMPAFFACPDDGDRHPGIIVYMDAPGMREELCNIGRRIATQGYACLGPDLYYRLGMLRFDIPRRDARMSPVIAAAKNHLDNAMVLDDTGGLIAWLDARDCVRPGPVGVIGYCMSGCYVMAAAAVYADRIAAAAALYGIGLVTDQPDSPHLMAERIKGEMYYGFAEVDPAVPAHVVPDLTAALDAAGTRYDMETIPDCHHGFQSPERPDYNPVAAEHAWRKVFALFERNLK